MKKQLMKMKILTNAYRIIDQVFKIFIFITVTKSYVLKMTPTKLNFFTNTSQMIDHQNSNIMNPTVSSHSNLKTCKLCQKNELLVQMKAKRRICINCYNKKRREDYAKGRQQGFEQQEFESKDLKTKELENTIKEMGKVIKTLEKTVYKLENKFYDMKDKQTALDNKVIEQKVQIGRTEFDINNLQYSKELGSQVILELSARMMSIELHQRDLEDRMQGMASTSFDDTLTLYVPK